MTIYLYKKTHKVTGLQYLGKTIKNPYKYKGSGDIWKNHIKEHGYYVITEIIKECQSKEELNYWGRYYSELWDVVANPSWANKIPETGGGIGVSSEVAKTNNLRRWNDPEYRVNMLNQRNTPENKTKNSNNLKNLWQSDDYRNKQLVSHRSEEYRKRNSILQKQVQNRPDVKQKLSGSNNYRYDHTKYEFIHKSGILENCTQYELIKKYNLNQQNLNAVVRKKRKHHYGWSLYQSVSN
jgi:hypothetical protein